MNAVADRIARNIAAKIATDIGARAQQVLATVALLDGGDRAMRNFGVGEHMSPSGHIGRKGNRHSPSGMPFG